MEPELIADFACRTGENPLWHPGENRLYWVDIPNGRLFRYDPPSNESELVLEDETIGGFTIQFDGSLLLFMGEGKVKQWREGQLHTVMEMIPGEEGNRFNDVIADPQGRVFAGTMHDENFGDGRLYRFDVDGSYRAVLSHIGLSNGMGFSPDLSTFYYVDSTPANTLYEFDYSAETGEITGQRALHQNDIAGVLDGMAVDAQGNIWIAHWGGACIRHYSPAGQFLARVDFPAAINVSSVAFAGDGYRDLYVTTAGGHDKRKYGSEAGALYRVRPEVPGKPEFLSRVSFSR